MKQITGGNVEGDYITAFIKRSSGQGPEELRVNRIDQFGVWITFRHLDTLIPWHRVVRVEILHS